MDLLKVVVISGQVAAGKSTLATGLADRYGGTRVSTKELLQQAAASRGDELPAERAALQAYGTRLDEETGGRWVSDAVSALISGAGIAGQASADQVPTLGSDAPTGLWVIDAVRIPGQIEALRSALGIDIVHVPYRGAAPAMTDLIAGRLQLYFDNMPGVLPQVRDGRVRALAVAGARRARALPDLPTVSEAGVPGFEASSWFGLGAPGTTPPALLERITAAVRTAMQDRALLDRLAEVGAEPGTLFGAAFARFVSAEREKWGQVVRASGARAD